MMMISHQGQAQLTTVSWEVEFPGFTAFQIFTMIKTQYFAILKPAKTLLLITLVLALYSWKEIIIERVVQIIRKCT